MNQHSTIDTMNRKQEGNQEQTECFTYERLQK